MSNLAVVTVLQKVFLMPTRNAVPRLVDYLDNLPVWFAFVFKHGYLSIERNLKRLV